MAKPAEEYTFDVFGHIMIVSRLDERWAVHIAGAEGKRRPALDIMIPPNIAASKLAEYLADLFHEWSTPDRSDVRRVMP